MTLMQLGTEAEIEIFKLSLTVGVFMGIIYDLLRIVRVVFDNRKARSAVTFALDFVYALMFGTVFFVFTLAQTDYVRGFVLVGMVLGAAVWSNTVGKLLLRIPQRLLRGREVRQNSAKQ